VPESLAEIGLLQGKTVGIDATTLEVNAAMRSIVRRASGEAHEEFLRRLAQESGIDTPTRDQVAKLDPQRAKKGSNEEWMNPHDPEAEITKLKDGAHAPGIQGRTCRGSGDGSGIGSDRGQRRGRGHGDDSGDLAPGGRTHCRNRVHHE